MSDNQWALVSIKKDSRRYRTQLGGERFATIVGVTSNSGSREYLSQIRRQIRRRGPGFFDAPVEEDDDVVWQAVETADSARVTLLIAVSDAIAGKLVVGQSAIPGWGTSDVVRQELGQHLARLVRAERVHSAGVEEPLT